MKWIIGLVVIGVLGFFGYQYMSQNAAVDAQNAAAESLQQAQEAATAAKASASEALAAVQDSMPAGINLTNITDNLDAALASASDAVSGITDVESAQAALPSLTEASTRLSGLGDTISRLPDAAQGPIAGFIAGGLATLQPMLDQVMAIPGVGPVIEPVVTPMLEKLNGLAG